MYSFHIYFKSLKLKMLYFYNLQNTIKLDLTLLKTNKTGHEPLGLDDDFSFKGKALRISQRKQPRMASCGSIAYVSPDVLKGNLW